MENKTYETLEDLLEDPTFRRWIHAEPGDHLLFWENWLKQHPDKKVLVEKAAALLKGIPFQIQEKPLDPEMIQSEWERLRKRTVIVGNLSPMQVSSATNSFFRIRSWGFRAVATIALLAILGFVVERYIYNPTVVYQTPFGHQLTVVLPDSTTVELNANSMLAYRKQSPRKVWLDGEAFFQVKKKPATDANFLVLTNDLNVEVLGTSFNVIEKKDKTEVVLEEGSIRLNLKRDFAQKLLMEPGDLVTFSTQSEDRVEKRQVKTQILTSWKDGVLEFEDVPLTSVMDRIETIYGWQPVYYNEALKTRKISIGLPSDDLESALLMLGKAIGIEIEKVQKEGKVLLLH